MPFNPIEISNDQGNRIGLYHFRWGKLNWYYTSADRPVVYGVDEDDNPITYEPVAISDAGVTLGGEIGYDFQINLPSDNPVAALYRVSPPSGRVYIKVRRMHWGDTEAPLYWSGTAGNIKPKTGAGVLMICRASISLLKQTGLRLSWGRQCPHALYDAQCQVDPADWTYAFEILSIVGNVVTLKPGGPDQDVGFFTGGIIRWLVADDTYNHRMVDRHTATRVFTIFGRGDGLSANQSIQLLPGCSRDTDATGCARFNNEDNFGGHKYMPNKSPFDGNPVF